MFLYLRGNKFCLCAAFTSFFALFAFTRSFHLFIYKRQRKEEQQSEVKLEFASFRFGLVVKKIRKAKRKSEIGKIKNRV